VRGTLTAAAIGVPQPTVQWQHLVTGSWTDIAGATGPSVLPTDPSGTEYRAVFSNLAGTAITAPASDTVSSTGDLPPVLLVAPTDRQVPAGTGASFTSMAGGTPAPTVQWQRSADGTHWTDITGASSSTLVTTALTTADSGMQYRAVFRSTGGTAISPPATVAVVGPDPVAPAVSVQPASQQAQMGAGATFTAAASGVPAPAVQWQTESDGRWTDIPGATADTLVLNSVAAAMQGTSYRAVFSNGSGSATSDVARLAVYQPLAVATATLPAATAGVPFSLQLRASGGPQGPRFWYLPAGSVLPPGLMVSPTGLLSGIPTAAGEFTFTVDVGDPAQATFTLVIAAAPTTGSTGTSTTTSGTSTTTASGTTSGTVTTKPSTGTTSRTTGVAASTGTPGTASSSATVTTSATESNAASSTGTSGSVVATSSGSSSSSSGSSPTGSGSSSTGSGSALSYTGLPAISELLAALGLLALGGLLLLAGARRRRRARHG
jgi:hypothetical protein